MTYVLVFLFVSAVISQVDCGGLYGAWRKGLTEIPTDIPNDASSLFMPDNKITILKENSFSKLSACVEIHLDDNLISKIEDNAFFGLSSLESLYLGDNKLAEVKKEMWVGLPELDYLRLSNNEIKLIQPETFKPLANLRSLYLSGNNISLVQSDMWTGLASLKILHLRDNSIPELYNNAFSPLTSLKELDLSFTNMERFTSETFTGLTSLDYLLLSGNKLISIPPGSFRDLPLEDLWLNYNQLITLSINIFYSSADDKSYPEKLDIWVGKLHCDWRICWMKAAQEAGWLRFENGPPSCQNYPGVKWEDVTLDCDGFEDLQKAYDVQLALDKLVQDFIDMSA